MLNNMVGFGVNLDQGGVITIANNASNGPVVPNTIGDRTTPLLNGRTILKIGVYNSLSQTGSVKIARQNSATNWDVVFTQSAAHGGTGFEDFTLSSPYTIPLTGTFHLAAYWPSGSPSITAAANRFVIASVDATVTNYTGVIEDSNVFFPMRYTYQ